jgi:hypothetical protein
MKEMDIDWNAMPSNGNDDDVSTRKTKKFDWKKDGSSNAIVEVGSSRDGQSDDLSAGKIKKFNWENDGDALLTKQCVELKHLEQKYGLLV